MILISLGREPDRETLLLSHQLEQARERLSVSAGK